VSVQHLAWYRLAPSPTSSFLALKTLENTDDDDEPADEGDIQMEYSSALAVQLKYRSSNKKICVIT